VSAGTRSVAFAKEISNFSAGSTGTITPAWIHSPFAGILHAVFRDGVRRFLSLLLYDKHLLCYLALVLVRVLKNRGDDTFRNMRQTLDQIHAVTVESQGARLVRRTQLNQDQKNLFRKLKVPEPPKILDFSGLAPVE